MRNIFFAFFYFIRFWLVYLVTRRPSQKNEYAAHNLFQPTYRIPESERNHPLLVIKYFLKLILLTVSKRSNNPLVVEKEGDVFIFDILRTNYNQRKNYINYFKSDSNVSGGIFKDELFYNSSFLYGFILVMLSFVWLPFLFISSLFKKDRAPFAIVFRELVEVINLLEICHKLDIKQLYYFCIYEKDANISTIILKKKGILINKITSEVPLSFWNKIIIADNLYICNGYHYDELKENKSSIFVSNIEFWGGEKILDNVSKYQYSVIPDKKSIGFYSTGTWLRDLENLMSKNKDLVKIEEQVKMIVKKFCKNNPEYQLIIFLHPRERKAKYAELTKNKYQKDFDGIDFQIEDDLSINTYEKANLGIAFYSSVVFERLFYGFKTIIMPIGLQDKFPIKNSNMNLICVYTESDLYSKIIESCDLSNKTFFEKNKINHFAKYLYN